MWLYQFLFVFVLLAVQWRCSDAYSIVIVDMANPEHEDEADGGSDNKGIDIEKEKHHVFLLHKGEARVIHHEETWKSLGYSMDNKTCEDYGQKPLYSWRQASQNPKSSFVHVQACIKTLDHSSLSKYKRGQPVPVIEKKNNSPDEQMRVEIMKSGIIQPSPLFDAIYIGAYINPSVVKWRGRLFMAAGLPWGIVDSQGGSETVEFRWINPRSLYGASVWTNKPSFHLQGKVRVVVPYARISGQNHSEVFNQIPNNQPYPPAGTPNGKGICANCTFLGVSDLVSSLNVHFLGQDPRMLVLDKNHVLVAYTDRFTQPLAMGMAILSINSSSSSTSTSSSNSNSTTGSGTSISEFDLDLGGWPVFVPALSPALAHNFPSQGYVQSSSGKNLPPQYQGLADKAGLYGGHPDSGGRNLVVSHLYPYIRANEDGLGGHKNDHKNWSPFLYANSTSTHSTSTSTSTSSSTTFKDKNTETHTEIKTETDIGMDTETEIKIDIETEIEIETRVKKPIVLRQDVLFIERINPLKVVRIIFPDRKIDENGRPYQVPPLASVVSEADKVDLSFWGYGQPRGGTPAVLVPHCGRDAAAAAGDSDSDSCYLSFFHSATALGNFYRTYVFGAYTFSTSPPFRLLSFTPLPVLTKKFYTGSFAEITQRRIDYVSFVMNFFIDKANTVNTDNSDEDKGDGDSDESDNGDVCVISFGAQDREGWLARIWLKDLLETMVPVEREK